MPAPLPPTRLSPRERTSLGGAARRLATDRRGANLVEYVILVGLVAILALFAFRFFGRSVRAKTDRQSATVQQHVQSEPR